MEAWSERAGPIFITREQYPWSDPLLENGSDIRRDCLTYNTYHTIKAFKDARCSMRLSTEQAEAFRRPCSSETPPRRLNATLLFDRK